MYPTTFALTSSLLLTLTLLILPLLTTLSPTPHQETWALTHVKTAVKTAFFVSLLPLFIFLDEGAETIVTN